jgi:sugar phosphate isomerase/epimerase
MSSSDRRCSSFDRRDLLKLGAAGAAGLLSASVGRAVLAQEKKDEKRPPRGKPTNFQVACMTLPYSAFPLERALTGLKSAGYKYCAWGTSHREADGKSVPVMAADAAPEKAAELGRKCRDLGLEPLMMFSNIYPENPKAMEVFTSRIKQASAAGIPHVLTFGHTRGGNRALWVERFKALAPVAKDHNVLIVIKQHGGETGTGAACGEIVREIDHPHVKVNYDAGNVMDYLKFAPAKVLEDMKACADEVRSFCIKDHRAWPRDQDCGPGFGEIDHYRLLGTVAFTGLTMPLCCENISAPVLPRPTAPEGVDALARRAREFLETVIAGLQA